MFRFSLGVDRPPLKVTAAAAAVEAEAKAAAERDDLMRRHASLTPGLFILYISIYIFFLSLFFVSLLLWVKRVIHCTRHGTVRQSIALCIHYYTKQHKATFPYIRFFFFFQIDVLKDNVVH